MKKVKNLLFLGIAFFSLMLTSCGGDKDLTPSDTPFTIVADFSCGNKDTIETYTYQPITITFQVDGLADSTLLNVSHTNSYLSYIYKNNDDKKYGSDENLKIVTKQNKFTIYFVPESETNGDVQTVTFTIKNGNYTQKITKYFKLNMSKIWITVTGKAEQAVNSWGHRYDDSKKLCNKLSFTAKLTETNTPMSWLNGKEQLAPCDIQIYFILKYEYYLYNTTNLNAETNKVVEFTIKKGTSEASIEIITPSLLTESNGSNTQHYYKTDGISNYVVTQQLGSLYKSYFTVPATIQIKRYDNTTESIYAIPTIR